MEFKGSKTASNVKAAFQGESMARNRYTIYEEQARREGHEDVAQLFARMAKNEMIHAKLLFKIMNGGIDDSLTNIKDAAKGEGDEWTSMYPKFAKTAREEGFEDIAKTFEQVAQIERDHEMTFLKAFAALKNKTSGTPEAEVEEPKAQGAGELPDHVYRCQFCGASFETRPDVRSVCQAIGAFDEIYR